MTHHREAASRRCFPISSLVVPPVAVALAFLAAMTALAVVGRLSGLQIPPATSARYARFRAVPQEAVNTGPPTARDALTLLQLGNAFTDALLHDALVPQIEAAAANASENLQTTRAGDLFRVAARILRLERSHETVDRWWPHIASLMPPADANLDHHLDVLQRVWSDGYADFGLTDGAAADLAAVQIDQPLGPFLEYLARSLGRLANERRAAGDTAAADACDALQAGMLKQWILAPGRAGMRILAAELLAEQLEKQDADADLAALAKDLRAWVATYREGVRQLPVDAVAGLSQTAFDGPAYERLSHRLAVLSWLGSAMIAAAAITLVLLPLWLVSDRRRMPPLAAVCAAGVVGMLISLAAASLWPRVWPNLPIRDFRSDFSSLRTVWIHPLLATAVVWTSAALLTIGLVRRFRTPGIPRARERLATGAAVGVWTWLLLSLVLMTAAAVYVEPARRALDGIQATAWGDEFTACAGPEADSLLGSLRAASP